MVICFRIPISRHYSSAPPHSLHPTAILLGTTRYQLDENSNLDTYLAQFRQNLNVNVNVMVGGSAKPKTDPERQKIQIFSTLQAFDEFLAKKFRS